MTYGQYIEQYITQQPLAAPIYTADISRMLADAFQMKPDKASSATAVAMKRLMDRRTIPSLRFYQNGIYYRTSVTPFGEMGIDKEQLIAHKYLNADQGYDTGAGLLYRMGLTTQLPNERLIATNAAQDCVRRDEKLNVSICPPKTKITAETFCCDFFSNILACHTRKWVASEGLDLRPRPRARSLHPDVT